MGELREKATFETLPREIRDQIYGYLLIFDGVIIPFPHNYENCENDVLVYAGPGDSYLTAVSDKDFAVPHAKQFLGYGLEQTNVFCPIGETYRIKRHQEPLWLEILRVNNKIHDEATTILCGKNIFRMSHVTYLGPRVQYRFLFWARYSQYFRHLVVDFDGRDVDYTRLMATTAIGIHKARHFSNSEWRDASGRFNQGTRDLIHDRRMETLSATFRNKARLISLMSNLTTLAISFENLLCPNGCCRREALEICLDSLGRRGLWNRMYFEGFSISKTVEGGVCKMMGLWDEQEQGLVEQMIQQAVLGG